MDVFFLFPGRVWIVFYLSLGSEQTKNPTGQKSFVSFGTFRRDTQFWCSSVNTFFNCFSGTNPMTPAPNDRTSSCEGLGRAANPDTPGALLFALRSLFR